MKLFGPTTKLSELAKIILSENIEKLEQRYVNGWDINEPFEVTEYINEPPIVLAASANKTVTIKWLLSKNSKVNFKNGYLVRWVCSNCDVETLKLFVEHGMNVNLKGHHKADALDSAIGSKKYDMMILLLENGYNLKKDGFLLREAAYEKDTQAIKILLDYGVDVNFYEPNTVFPFNPSAIAIAVKENDIETVKLLLKHGADITIKDNRGERPYNIAVRNKNTELIELIKSLEPKEWHNDKQILNNLKSYNIPEKILEILKSENRRMEIDHPNLSYIEFNSIENLREIIWKKHKCLDLLSEVDDFDEIGFLMWNPEKACLASIDYEHGNYRKLGGVELFFKNPAKQIEKLWKEPRY